jgi:P-type Cu+ transporter
MSRRFWVGLLLTMPVVALEMGGHLFDLHHFMTLQTSNWLQFLFGTPVVLWPAGRSSCAAGSR